MLRANGLEIAREFGVKTEILSHPILKGWAYDKNLVEVLERYDVSPNNGLICLAGYMRILSHEFVNRYKMHIINIHPSLLPSFPGLACTETGSRTRSKGDRLYHSLC